MKEAGIHGDQQFTIYCSQLSLQRK